jgi:predicted ArsR family transcriptional regulator
VEQKRDLRAFSELHEPTRARLYEYVVSRREPVTRDQAAEEVGIGRTLVAYHLDRLCEAGLLTASFARTTGRSGPGAGRTAKLYRRSGREFEATEPARDYLGIAELLARAIDADPTGATRAAAERTALEAGRTVDGETGGLVDRLAARGYRPATDGDGVIRLHNCPFHRLASSHRELVCSMNRSLLEGLLEVAGEHGREAVLAPHAERCCVELRPRG